MFTDTKSVGLRLTDTKIMGLWLSAWCSQTQRVWVSQLGVHRHTTALRNRGVIRASHFLTRALFSNRGGKLMISSWSLRGKMKVHTFNSFSPFRIHRFPRLKNRISVE